jgi:hypothetical protein
MSGGLRSSWEHLRADVWETLAEYSTKETTAPEDLFSDLFASADEFISPRSTPNELEEARNNPEKARQRFLALKGTDFTSEFDIVLFLEEAYEVLGEYEIPGYDDLYKRLIRDTLHKFNLRYRLDDPFTLRFLLPGSFTNLYGELQRVNFTNAHLASLLTDFEKAFDRYARTQDATDLKTCIASATKYAEGLAGVTCGQTGSLGDLSKQIRDWPHTAVQKALSNLYGFCSDYPGIRHAGNPQGVQRALATRDVTLASLLLLSFSGYLTPMVDERTVLGL